jgi:hypothetical protein
MSVSRIVIDLTKEDEEDDTVAQLVPPRRSGGGELVRLDGPLLSNKKKRKLAEPLFVYSYGVGMFGFAPLWKKDDLWIPLNYSAQRERFRLDVERQWLTNGPRLVFTDLETGHSILCVSWQEAARLWKSFSGINKSWIQHFGLNDPHELTVTLKKQEQNYSKNKKIFETTCLRELNFADFSALYQEQPKLLMLFTEY